MFEELCRDAFHDVLMDESCRQALKKQELVSLRGIRRMEAERIANEICTNAYIDFFGTDIRHPQYDWSKFPVSQLLRRQSKDKLLQKCWQWFGEHERDIAEAYIKKTYGDHPEDIITSGSTFKEEFNKFKSYFDERRKQYMETQELAIEERKKQMKLQNQKPQSHGGVANLLKVLTKTMVAQGSSLATIAKTQYAICIQAGILIPNEFLTDVMVATEVIDSI